MPEQDSTKTNEQDTRGSDGVAPVAGLTAAENEQRVGYTMGPWEAVPSEGISEDLDDCWGVRRQGETSGMSIAQMVWKSDAHLIALTPDLLALVRRVAKHFQDTDAPLGRDAAALLQKVEGR